MNNTSLKRENTSTKPRVFVGLSGGVDSATSAAILKKEGYEVVGVFIKIQLSGYPCPAAEDRLDAMRVAAHLDIPFVEIDLSKEYEARVFESSVKEFERGRTPNPDVLCNREIKFGVFYDFAMKNDADYIATGHYARTSSNPVCLLMGRDGEKDQSYFLWMVPQAHLARTLFPIGGMKKSEVRKLAESLGLPNFDRPDSQGLCFLGDISLQDMLVHETHPEAGEVVSEGGEVLGTHKGISLYTLGQRHGFDINPKESDSEPHFVIGKDTTKNQLIVSHQKFPSHSTKTELSLTEVNWIGEVKEGEYLARFRYRQKLIKATLSIDSSLVRVSLHEPQYVPLGQSLVLYDGERCIGGGIIDAAALI